mgnify:CR=1 FL=1
MSDAPKTLMDFVNEARARIREVEPGELARMMEERAHQERERKQQMMRAKEEQLRQRDRERDEVRRRRPDEAPLPAGERRVR